MRVLVCPYISKGDVRWVVSEQYKRNGWMRIGIKKWRGVCGSRIMATLNEIHRAFGRRRKMESEKNVAMGAMLACRALSFSSECDPTYTHSTLFLSPHIIQIIICTHIAYEYLCRHFSLPLYLSAVFLSTYSFIQCFKNACAFFWHNKFTYAPRGWWVLPQHV